MKRFFFGMILDKFKRNFKIRERLGYIIVLFTNCESGINFNSKRLSVIGLTKVPSKHLN